MGFPLPHFWVSSNQVTSKNGCAYVCTLLIIRAIVGGGKSWWLRVKIVIKLRCTMVTFISNSVNLGFGDRNVARSLVERVDASYSCWSLSIPLQYEANRRDCAAMERGEVVRSTRRRNVGAYFINCSVWRPPKGVSERKSSHHFENVIMKVQYLLCVNTYWQIRLKW